MSQDPRSSYIANMAATSFGAPELAAQIASSPEVAQFLNELSCKVLQILSDGVKFKCFAGALSNPPPTALEIHFVKTSEGSEEID